MNDKHDLLCQVFRQGWFTTARPKEGNELRCKGIEKSSERLVVRRLEKFCRHLPFMGKAFICDRLIAHSGTALVGWDLYKALPQPKFHQAHCACLSALTGPSHRLDVPRLSSIVE